MNAKQGNVFEKQFTNHLDNLVRVIEEAVRFLEDHGVTEKAVNLAHLAIEEMATNILKYGYDDSAIHHIVLRMQIEPGTLLIRLEDDGHEFNPLEAPPPDLNVPLEAREPGGLGIHLVRHLASHVEYQRCEGRNRLTIRIAAAEHE